MLALLSTRFVASAGVKWQCISQLKLYIWTTLVYRIGWDQHCTGDIFPVYVKIVTESHSGFSYIHCCVVSLSCASVYFTLVLPYVVAEDVTVNSLRLRDAYMCNLTIIGSDNDLSTGGHQAIIWTNVGLLSIGTNFNKVLIRIHILSIKKTHLKCCLRNVGHFASAHMC